jgi:hypothetical protein
MPTFVVVGIIDSVILIYVENVCVVHTSGSFAAMPLTPLGSPSLCFGDVSR